MKRWMNDEMGKAAHVGVGRLLRVDDMGNWPRKGVMQCRMKKVQKKSTAKRKDGGRT